MMAWLERLTLTAIVPPMLRNEDRDLHLRHFL
jgi:hypothetical protein